VDLNIGTLRARNREFPSPKIGRPVCNWNKAKNSSGSKITLELMAAFAQIGTLHGEIGSDHRIAKEEQMDEIGKKMPQLTQSAQHFVAQTNALHNRLEIATKQATQLFNCYPDKQTIDANVFVAACVTILAAFPENVGRTVVDPVNGLPSKLKWFPSLAEIRAECERLTRILHASEQRKADLEKQIAEAIQRDRELAELPLEASRHCGQVYDATRFTEAVIKHGRPIGVFERGREIAYRA
jgi:hypothetical protein